MPRTNLDRIEKLLKDERSEVNKIDSELNFIKHEIFDKTPNQFCMRDIVRSFFGALLVAFGFIFKGALISTAVRLDLAHIIAIVICSIITLFFEIYYFGYRKIEDKERRRLGQFVMKRLPTFYLVAIMVSAGLIFLYGINLDPTIGSNYGVIKIVVAVSFPASIGAGLSDLLKRYGAF